MRLHGRSSSHFTRIARIFAAELEVALDFHVVADLMSDNPADYGGNPALKMPTLETGSGSWFGALGICRELSRRSALDLDIAWPEDLHAADAANAQELVMQAMATDVALVMGRSSGVPADNAHQAKLRASLAGTMRWLEEHATGVVGRLSPARDLSYLEVALFCLVEHLHFRDVLAMDDYPALRAFAAQFGQRRSARSTAFRFDVPVP